ncbi:hypothetical protein HYW35_03390 [Candidatus Saccharibacteria bacterium]|nr:hypothetical protein [Candidatus Saccharibacteria bacterium]
MPMPKQVRGERGLASVVVVTVLTVVITLISLGFARLTDRSVNNSTNNQASNIASYGAQSAINDAASYIKDHPTAASTSCSGEGSLIGSSTAPGPFYNDSNLSGDAGRSTRYTCLLVNQEPKDLLYQRLPPSKSRVIKMTTSASPGELDKIMLSWQPTNTQVTGYPPSSTPLLDITTWNGSANNYLPLLRLTLYPVPTGGSVANLEANSKTVFLYPQSSSGPVPTQSYSAMKNGSPLPVACTKELGVGSFNGSADFTCNLIISNLAAAIALPDKLDYFYLRLTPIYNQADVRIQANNAGGQILKILRVQALIDATATSGGVAKRLQARLDISGSDENIDPFSDSIPEYALRSAGAVCKRLVGITSPYSYTQLDGPPAVCNQLGDPIIYTPAPTLDFTINAVDSETTDDFGQKGTAYTDSSAALAWTSTDAAGGCSARAAAPRADWSGNKNLPPSTWSGSTNTGSQNIPSITNRTTFTLSCSGPGSGGAPLERTVTAWPPPTASISDPGPVVAGTSFTLTWNANNASQCQFSDDWTPAISPVSNPGGAPISGNQTIATDWDDTSARSYTITCNDPPAREATYTRNLTVTWPPPTVTISGPSSITAGDSFTLSWSVGNSSSCSSSGWPTPISLSGLKGQPKNDNQTIATNWRDNGTQTYTITCDNPGGSFSRTWNVGINGDTKKSPPTCTADWNLVDKGDGTGTLSWNGACPTFAAGAGFYYFTDCTPELAAVTNGCRGVGNAASQTVGPGHYSGTFHSGVEPWGTRASSANKSFDVVAPPVHVIISKPSTIWIWPDSDYDFSFKTSQPLTPNDCRDGLHRLVLCFDIDAYQGTDTFDNRSKIAYCEISTGGVKINTSNNGRGSQHWSRQGKWIDYTIGWFDLPRYTQPGNNYDFIKDVYVSCVPKPEYGSVRGSDSKTVRWKTCADRGQQGIYATDAAQNDCSNPPPPPPPGPPRGDVIVTITDNRCISRNAQRKCNRTSVSYASSQANGTILRCNESWSANNGSGSGPIPYPSGTFSIGGLHPGGSITVSCTSKEDGWVGTAFATLFY